MDLEFRIEEKGTGIELFSIAQKGQRLLRDAIDDIADFIELEAIERAPFDTGELALHPVDRDDTRVGIVDPRNPLFGGGFAIRGETGFIPGVGTIGGHLVARSTLTVAKQPRHAIFVHEGTGIYGPRKSIITPRTKRFMVFEINGRIFKKKFVLGQRPQPYLTEAFLFVNKTFVPIRIEELRARLKLET